MREKQLTKIMLAFRESKYTREMGRKITYLNSLKCFCRGWYERGGKWCWKDQSDSYKIYFDLTLLRTMMMAEDGKRSR